MTDRLDEIAGRLQAIGKATAEFISHSPEDTAWLISRVRQLGAWIENYSEHGDECMARSNPDYPCSCGLTDLIDP